MREAILNAVAHKDYSSGAPIQISVYEDKIMLWNDGELHEGWTVETLKGKHSSKPYNPDVANAFFRAGMIELWGRGIEHIVNACTAEGATPPEFRFEHGGLWVVFEFPPNYVMGASHKQVTGQVIGQVTGQVEAWVIRVVIACVVEALSSAELQAIIGIKHRETFQRNYLDRLLSEHWLERTIPDKPRSRLQKYRLTEKGEALVKNRQNGGAL